MTDRASIPEKLLHMAHALRDQLDGPDLAGARRDFAQSVLAMVEKDVDAIPALEVRAIRRRLPRRDDAHGRAAARYVDGVLDRQIKRKASGCPEA